MTEEQTEDPPPFEGRHNLDISLLMQHIDRLKSLLGPVIFLGGILAEIRRWEYGFVYMVLLLSANNIVLVLPLSVSFVLWFSFIVLLATLGYVHSTTNLLVKVLPSTSEDSPVDTDMDHRELIQKYRTFLFDLDDWILWLNKKLTKFYRLVKWDDAHLSVRFYVAVISVIVLLHVIPAKCAFILLVNVFLLHYKILQVIQRRNTHLKEDKTHIDCNGHDRYEELPDSQEILNMQYDPVLGSASDLENDSDDEAEPYELETAADISSLDKAEILRLGEDYEKEIKRSNGTGNCVKCGSAFTSVLKRRKLCSHCGNHYCSKCCSHKVPRSLFGATSPAAQTETVLVCEYCYLFLTGEKDKEA